MSKTDCRRLSVLKRLPLAAFALFVAGCSLAPGGEEIQAAASSLLGAGEADRITYNDQKARVLLILPCDITVGAYYRLANSAHQEAIALLCSGRRPGDPLPPL